MQNSLDPKAIYSGAGNCPLVIEIGLLVALSGLLKQADMELEKSVRAQKITSAINSISKMLYDAFFMYSTEKMMS